MSPAYHRLHHASTRVDDRVAVNFGFVLVCWDRLARCAVFPTGGDADRDRDRRPAGSDRADRPALRGRPASSVAQLVQPFAYQRRHGRAVMIAAPTRVRDIYRQVERDPRRAA